MVAFPHVLSKLQSLLCFCISLMLIAPIIDSTAAQKTVVRDPKPKKCDYSALDTDNRSLKGPVRAVLLESSRLIRDGSGWKRAPRVLIETRAYHPSGLLVEHVGYDSNVPFEKIDSAVYRFKYVGLPDDKGRLIGEKRMSKDSFQSQSIYQYDESGVLRKSRHESNLMAGILTSYTYDANGDLVEVTETSLGSNSTLSSTLYSYNYNEYGQLLSCLNQNKSALPPQSTQLELFFDRNGNVIEVTEQLSADNAHKTHLVYDEKGRLIRKVYVSLVAKRQTLSTGAQIVWDTEGVVYTEELSYDQADLYGNWTIKRVILTEGPASESMSGIITLGLNAVSREEYRTLTYY